MEKTEVRERVWLTAAVLAFIREANKEPWDTSEETLLRVLECLRGTEAKQVALSNDLRV